MIKTMLHKAQHLISLEHWEAEIISTKNNFKSWDTTDWALVDADTFSVRATLTLQRSIFRSYAMRCAFWYHLYDFKNVKNTHEGVLLLVKLQA